MTPPFIDLQATHNPHRWRLPLAAHLCVGAPGREFMFGGVGLAAAIGALEAGCGRDLVWATAQYLAFARPPSVVDLDVRIPAAGRHVTQARVVGHVGDTEIFTVNAALGARPDAPSRQWAQASDVPPPDRCDETQRWRDQDGGLHGELEVRLARGRAEGALDGRPSLDGRLILWIRPRSGRPIDSRMLAIMADHAPSAVGPALGRNAGGNSLDNTIRFLGAVATDWVLCDIAIGATAHGFAHGSVRLFSETGLLMAIASQSMIVRLRDAAPVPPAGRPG